MSSVEDQRIIRFKPRYVSWVWNCFAVIGLLTLVYFAGSTLLDRFSSGFCAVAVDSSSVNADATAKATLFRTECGAAAADRVHIVLSNAKVDGVKHGFEVLTVVNLAGPVELKWIDPRTLSVRLSAGEIEYEVTKTRGISIQVDRSR